MSPAARVATLLIRAYQLTLGAVMGNVCRFEPSCSRYTAACIEHLGLLRGGWRGLLRILRCHPFHPGGWDPPPLPRGAVFTSAAARTVSCRPAHLGQPGADATTDRLPG